MKNVKSVNAGAEERLGRRVCRNQPVFLRPPVKARFNPVLRNIAKGGVFDVPALRPATGTRACRATKRRHKCDIRVETPSGDISAGALSVQHVPREGLPR